MHYQTAISWTYPLLYVLNLFIHQYDLAWLISPCCWVSTSLGTKAWLKLFTLQREFCPSKCDFVFIVKISFQSNSVMGLHWNYYPYKNCHKLSISFHFVWFVWQCIKTHDAIWRRRSGSTLAQVMACCLTAPSHYLNQCWLIISKIQTHSSDGNFAIDASVINDQN